MKRFLKTLRRTALLAAAACLGLFTAHAGTTNPAAVTSLLNRIGGEGAADRFVTVVDESVSTAGEEVFVITSSDGKPCIKGSTLSALTTGINWYLNYYAHVNLTWNRLTTDLTTAALPLPAADETHTTKTDYRYYLNYCTFSYSASTWTWERWQKEIDWMALHGINMPLQIVGLDVVWRNLLVKDLGYTDTEAGEFIAGPCFQAWWGMNNLEGWGGPNPSWWYERQETLCKKILARERELGMEPVLPGYSGMVPSDIAEKGYTANSQGNWCYFVRPYILDPNSQAFTDISEKYYARLAEVMGTSGYYSMDPFHEGGNTSGIDVPSAYKSIYNAMLRANADAKWVIQYWQWSAAQYNVLSQVDKGRLVILDLFSDAHTHFGEYDGHDAVYCSLPNFGGRTGLFGRLSKTMTEYFKYSAQYSNIKGIGATPEAIEQVPVLYDALFELPWRASAPDPAEWVKQYATNRYGTASDDAASAWELLRNSALNCETTLQGPQEAVVCARPAMSVGYVSSWGGTDIFYDAQDVAHAAALLLSSKLSGENYDYDLTDVTRQALTDYAYYLLKAVNAADTSKDTEAYAKRRDLYLGLILDLDKLLSTNSNFMVGRWTQLARGIADEAAGTTADDKQWLELDNARTLISTWGDRDAAEYGGLRDYSYREWGGMMKDYYYARWKTFFDNRDAGKSQPDWFTTDWNWAHNSSLQYTDTPVGTTADVAAELFAKYFLSLTSTDGTAYYAYRGFEQDLRKTLTFTAYRGEAFSLPLNGLGDGITASLSIDTDNDGTYGDGETFTGTTATIPADGATGSVKATLTLSDGTVIHFTLIQRDNITSPRTVSVKTADAAQGSAAIEGSDGQSVTSTDIVTIKATAAAGYDFLNWTDDSGKVVGNTNPYVYYGKDPQTFTANFMVSKWTVPAEDLSDLSTIDSYGQYLASLSVTQNEGDPAAVYEAGSVPERLYQTTSIVNAAAGSRLTLSWKGINDSGLGYCRLSAYIDLNSDGDFDDEDEFITTVGDFSTSSNTAVANGSVDVLLPYDIPLGITHIRFRFDSAWKTDDLNSETQAVKADAATTRMVYDVPVNVTEYAETPCTVSVAAADNNGTVDANGQPDTYTYKAGEEIVLRVYPATGYALDHWTDRYGRTVPSSWVDGNFLRFRAPESGTYTAHFVSTKTLACGDWTLGYEDTAGGVSIISIKSGNGDMDLRAGNCEGKTVVAVKPGILKDNAGVTSITLPASLTDLDHLVSANFSGAGVQNATITPASTIQASQAWTLTLTATTDGSSFNDWGSGLLATGTDALANTYNGGFQFYLAAAGTLTVKVGDNGTGFTTPVGSKFTIRAAYDGSGTLTVTLTAEDGTTETRTFSQTLADITTFATALPTGVNITDLVVSDPLLAGAPFSGCTALTDINVEKGNAAFSSTDGVLYDATGSRLLAYPEGRLTRRAFTLSTTANVSRMLNAAPAFTADGAQPAADASLRLGAAKAAEADTLAALLTLVPVDGGYALRHVNTGLLLAAYKTGGSAAANLTAGGETDAAVLTYALTISGNTPMLSLTTGTRSLAGPSNSGATFSTQSTSLRLAEVKSVAPSTVSGEWSTLCLPVAAVCPAESEAKVYTVTSVTKQGDKVCATLSPVAAGSVIAAGEGVIVRTAGTAAPTFVLSYGETDAADASAPLLGTTTNRTNLTGGTLLTLADSVSGPAFYASTATTLAANTAAVLRSSLPADAAGAAVVNLMLDGTILTGIALPVTDGETDGTAYGIDGRRVKAGKSRRLPSGLYIIDGRKTLHR